MLSLRLRYQRSESSTECEGSYGISRKTIDEIAIRKMDIIVEVA